MLITLPKSQLHKLSLETLSNVSFVENDDNLELYAEITNSLKNNVYYLLSDLTQVVKTLLPSIVRGDVILFQDSDYIYRNDSKVIWDGQQCLNLDYTDDEYGSVPPSFLINEFPTTDHFIESIGHNSYVRLNANDFDFTFVSKFIMDSDDINVIFYKASHKISNLIYDLYFQICVPMSILTVVESNIIDFFNNQQILRFDCQPEYEIDRSELVKERSLFRYIEDYNPLFYQHENKINIVDDLADRTKMVDSIIRSIRGRMLAMMANDPDCDIWDEAQNGVNWINNEIQGGNEVIFHPSIMFDECHTVIDASYKLVQYDLKYLTILNHFVQLGGTDSPVFQNATKQ